MIPFFLGGVSKIGDIEETFGMRHGTASTCSDNLGESTSTCSRGFLKKNRPFPTVGWIDKDFPPLSR